MTFRLADPLPTHFSSCRPRERPGAWKVALAVALLSAACDDGQTSSGAGNAVPGGDPVASPGGSPPGKTVGGQTGDEFGEIIQALSGDAERLPAMGPKVGAAADDLASFSWSFYRQTADLNKNFVFSPYSIATCAAMLYAGASGNTKSQMAEALHFTGQGEAFHQARNDLAHFLEARNIEATEERNAQVLRASNDFWLAPGLEPEKGFLNVLSAHYGAPVHLTQFGEEARQAINGKVAADTNDLIQELLPPRSLDSDTVFVLTNALYFKARWSSGFNQELTEKSEFLTPDGEQVEVDLMYAGGGSMRYATTAEYEAVGMGYSGGELEFIAVAPTAGTFDEFASEITVEQIATVSQSLSGELLNLRFPRFETATEVPLKVELVKAGMVDAFNEGNADFRALTPIDIWIDAAFHKTKIVVDEEGTEAAAATALAVAGPSSVPPTPREVTIDRPFVYFIRDVETQAVLFVGHFVGVGMD